MGGSTEDDMILKVIKIGQLLIYQFHRSVCAHFQHNKLSTMVFRRKISAEVRAYTRFLRQDLNLPYSKISKRCKISATSAKRICKEDPFPQNICKSNGKTGRPRKISENQGRYILREVKKLRMSEGSFSIPRLMTAAGLSQADVSRRTVIRFLHSHGYRYRQTRRKGLLSPEDLLKRKKFALKMVKRPATFWSKDISFYIDGVCFVYKTNPLDQARTPKSTILRKKSEGLVRGCTTKGKKEGSGGKVAKFMVAVTHGKGVIACEPFEKMNGQYFANFITDHFPTLFNVSDKDTAVFVQDGDPSQNSNVALEAMAGVNAQLLSIPARSPDLNPIENFFHLVRRRLSEDAIQLNLHKESFEDFQERIIQTMKAIPVEILNKTIESTKKRLQEIISNGGQRTKY